MTVPEHKYLIRAVIDKYARRYDHGPDRGKPIKCRPTRAEKQGLIPQRFSKDKVIYDTWEAAELAAQEMEALGALPQRPFACHRSKHGHVHLTLDKSPGTKKRYGRIEK